MMPSAMGQNNPQLGVRKVIPDASKYHEFVIWTTELILPLASGFSFLDSNGTKKNPDDAFSFVKDAMTTKK